MSNELLNRPVLRDSDGNVVFPTTSSDNVLCSEKGKVLTTVIDDIEKEIQQAHIIVDTELNEKSGNAIANSAVTRKTNELANDIAQCASKKDLDSLQANVNTLSNNVSTLSTQVTSIDARVTNLENNSIGYDNKGEIEDIVI